MVDALGPSASGVPAVISQTSSDDIVPAVASEMSQKIFDANISHGSGCSLSMRSGSAISIEQETNPVSGREDAATAEDACSYDFIGSGPAGNSADAGERLRQLEDEHDALNTSLISISTQFAQVQFRLKQLSATTSAEERDALLKELEHVAFEGCPDLYGATQLLREEKQSVALSYATSEQQELTAGHNTHADDIICSSNDEDDDELLTGVNNHRSKSLGSARSQSRSKKNRTVSITTNANPRMTGFDVDGIAEQHVHNAGSGLKTSNTVQPSRSGDCVNITGANSTPTVEDERRRLEMVEIISKLRKQVEDLESLAYQQGHIDAPPSKLILERQKEVIDQLRSRLNIKVGEGFEKLTKAELRSRLDAAIGSVMIPMKEKEIMLEQLLHQVKDLERFIEFLQCESNPQTKQPTSVDNSVGLSRKPDEVLPNRAKGIRLPRQTTSEFDLPTTSVKNSFAKGTGDLSSNSSAPDLSYLNNPTNVNRDAWISTFAAKSHAVLHVLSYMLVCGSREQQQQQASFFASANDKRRDSLPFDCATPSAVIDSPVFSTFQNRSAMFRSNQLKATPAGSHYGDERAVLELAVGHVQEILDRRERSGHTKFSDYDYSSANYYGTDEHYSSGSDDEAMVNEPTAAGGEARKSGYIALVRCVRRELAPALMALMRHGYAPDRLQRRGAGLLRNAVMLLPGAAYACVPSMMKLPSLSMLSGGRADSVRGSKSLHHISSLAAASADTRKSCLTQAHALPSGIMTSTKGGGDADKYHPWHLILDFYNMKDGAAYNRSASKKLADAFALPSAGVRAVTSRETLLATIAEIVETHSKLKRSLNSYFKAFVCAGLNGRVLASWLRLIYSIDKLIEANYEPWSYAARTRFSDALTSIDMLIIYDFSLPVDFAVRRLQNLNDAF